MRFEAAEYLRIDHGESKILVTDDTGIFITKTILAALVATTLSGSAFAQVIQTPNSGAIAVPPGAPGVGTPQSGSTGAPGAANYFPFGQPADVISNDSSAGGDANQPSRVAPQGGSGSGGNGQ